MLALDMNQHNIVKGFKFGKEGCATVNFISPNHMRRNKAFEEFRCFVTKTYNYSPPLYFLLAVKKEKLQIKEPKMKGEFYSEENLAINKKKFEPSKSEGNSDEIKNPILPQKNENIDKVEKIVKKDNNLNQNNAFFFKIPQKTPSNLIKNNESCYKKKNSEGKEDGRNDDPVKKKDEPQKNEEIDIFKNFDETDTNDFLENIQQFNPTHKLNIRKQENLELSNSLQPLGRSRIDISLDRHSQKQVNYYLFMFS